MERHPTPDREMGPAVCLLGARRAGLTWTHEADPFDCDDVVNRHADFVAQRGAASVLHLDVANSSHVAFGFEQLDDVTGHRDQSGSRGNVC